MPRSLAARCAYPALALLGMLGCQDRPAPVQLGEGAHDASPAASADAGQVTAVDASRSFDAAAAPSWARFDAAVFSGEPTLSELSEVIFTPTCVLGRCHVTAAPAAELSLSGRRIRVYDALVNAPSSEVAGRMRVVPFDPEASYLMEKIAGQQPQVGNPMPPMAPLPASYVARIRRWIELGAPDN